MRTEKPLDVRGMDFKATFTFSSRCGVRRRWCFWLLTYQTRTALLVEQATFFCQELLTDTGSFCMEFLELLGQTNLYTVRNMF